MLSTHNAIMAIKEGRALGKSWADMVRVVRLTGWNAKPAEIEAWWSNVVELVRRIEVGTSGKSGPWDTLAEANKKVALGIKSVFPNAGITFGLPRDIYSAYHYDDPRRLAKMGDAPKPQPTERATMAKRNRYDEATQDAIVDAVHETATGTWAQRLEAAKKVGYEGGQQGLVKFVAARRAKLNKVMPKPRGKTLSEAIQTPPQPMSTVEAFYAARAEVLQALEAFKKAIEAL